MLVSMAFISVTEDVIQVLLHSKYVYIRYRIIITIDPSNCHCNAAFLSTYITFQFITKVGASKNRKPPLGGVDYQKLVYTTL